MTPWYKESFGEDYLLVYKHRSQEEADQQITQILPLLNLKRTDRILDLCCGTGRHAIALAKSGYEVTGLDLSNVLLSYAHRNSGDLSVQFIQGDMRTLPFADRSFDVVLNLFTSFGYFVKDDENKKVLQEISRVLVPGGRFLIDFLNRGYVRKHFQPFTERKVNGVTIREERSLEDDYVKKKITIIEGASERIYYERVRMYKLEEMPTMIERSGLTVDRVLGGYDGTAHSEDASRMMFFGYREES